MVDYTNYVVEHVIDLDCSGRGGKVKVDVSELFPYVSDPVMGAYQNYLGGGMLGAVIGGAMFDPSELHKRDIPKFVAVKEACKVYLHNQTNHVDDEWEEQSYKQNQSMPVSAY